LLKGIYFTGGSLNFARSLGPAIVNHSFPHYFWIYFLGPLLGSGLASGFYYLLNMMRYETCNPGQDADGLEAAVLGGSGTPSFNQDTLPSTYGQGTGGTYGGNTNEKDQTAYIHGARHQRNFSEATAVNGPGYADTATGLSKENPAGNHAGQGDDALPVGQAYSGQNGNPYTVQSPVTIHDQTMENQRVPLNTVQER
jgi:aquaporin related protein